MLGGNEGYGNFKIEALKHLPTCNYDSFSCASI